MILKPYGHVSSYDHDKWGKREIKNYINYWIRWEKEEHSERKLKNQSKGKQDDKNKLMQMRTDSAL